MISTPLKLSLSVAGLLLATQVAATAPAGRYTFPASGLVYDTRTKLTWTDPSPVTQQTWTGAKNYCTNLTTSNGGWRLPTVAELSSLLDLAATSAPKIDHAAFPNTANDHYWTSTPMAGDSTKAWIVSFTDRGGSQATEVDTERSVRCVR